MIIWIQGGKKHKKDVNVLEGSRGGSEDAQRAGARLPWRQAESWG